jgi:hypothetical protein
MHARLNRPNVYGGGRFRYGDNRAVHADNAGDTVGDDGNV